MLHGNKGLDFSIFQNQKYILKTEFTKENIAKNHNYLQGFLCKLHPRQRHWHSRGAFHTNMQTLLSSCSYHSPQASDFNSLSRVFLG